MKKLFILNIYLFAFGFFTYASCTLPAPAKFKSQKVESCQFGITWQFVEDAYSYNVKYREINASDWITLVNIGDVSSYVVTGLQPSTTYKVKVAAICSNGKEGLYTSEMTLNTPSCSTPFNLGASAITSTSAIIFWSASCEQSFKLQYRKSNNAKWIVINHLKSSPYTFMNLNPATAYEVKIKSECGDNNNSDFSSLFNFTTIDKEYPVSNKNVLLVIIDDARYDTYTATGGPDFFADTNMSRIADEGANFKLTYVAQSQCAPSRGSIVTGTYPHIHGVKSNPPENASDTITLITLPQILHQNNYFTGLIGKYHISKYPQPGYDFWMENHRPKYIDSKYDINGNENILYGHQSDVLTDSAIAFFHKVPGGKPFFLWLAYKAPHSPYTPRPEDEGLFDNDTMPFPRNYELYDKNYPGFLYDCSNSPDSTTIVQDYRSYFEALQGVEVNLGRIWNELENMGIMDSTLIIFMSDNGYLFGEHHLYEKKLAYEESIHVPLFMRYPKTIKSGTVVKNQIAMNIDIAPTILDFAAIRDTFGMQGISLLKMLKDKISRIEFMYEWNHEECVPDMRAVRSLSCKYVQYYCNDTTEEFFNLKDEHENNNEVLNPQFADLVALYRDKLNFWRNYYQDYSYDTLYTCSLSNLQHRMINQLKDPLIMLNIFPNPSHHHFTIHFMSSEKNINSISITNMAGKLLYNEITDLSGEFVKQISTESLAAGNYCVVVQNGSHTYHKMFVVQ
ncbi:MAG: sulfatase-like hydrolase/transferase [Chitinophagales bacterium]|nr:sulfatase-like hydrolase/transferase [Chitinophagales bacterium]